MSLADVYESLVAEDATVDSEAVDNPESGITESESEYQDQEDFDSDTSVEEPEDATDDEPGEVADLFDWEAYADQLIPVKVDGEELLVPLREARDGIMLRKDYSRKTEELAKERKMVDWAKDVQYAFETDPVGTLKAFAQAYGLDQPTANAPQVPEVDPYEDWDPEIAQVARAFDQKLAEITNHYEQKISRIESQTGQITHERMVQQAQSEMQSLKAQFTEAGFDFDELEVLKVATSNEIDLTQAAYIWAGSQAVRGGKSQAEAKTLASQAANAAALQGEAERKQAKRRVSTTATKQYEAGSESLDASEFKTLTDLFNLEMANQ